MIPTAYENFTQAYYSLVDQTYNGYEYETAPRDMKIRENLFTSFVIVNPRDRLLYVPERKFSLHYLMAEILWYISGCNRTDWISNYSSFWSQISDDGVTANSAYGARIFVEHDYQEAYDKEGIRLNYTQWQYVKDELTRDRDSRRAVIHIRQPQDSALAVKDMPCTLNLQFFIRDQKLHLIVQMRSNDLILGTALDVPAFTFLQEMMALELGVELGYYYHTSNSMHIYERHYNMCEDILNNEYKNAKIVDAMPRLKSLPPTKLLFELEARARKTTKSSELVALGNEARLYDDIMWTDWAHILLAHRARKIGNEDLAKWFEEGVTLRCFKELL